jgi:hypothetical protein
MPRFNGLVTVNMNTSLRAANKLVARDRLLAIINTTFAAPRWRDVIIDIKLDEIGELDDADDNT